MDNTTQDRTLARPEAAASPSADPVLPARRANFLRTASEAVLKGVAVAPFQTAMLISVPAAVACIAVGSGSRLYSALTASLEAGGPVSMVLLAAIYGLVSTQTLAWIKDAVTRRDQEVRTATALSQMAQHLDSDSGDRRGSNERLQRIERSVDDMREAFGTLAMKQKPLTVLRKNTEEPWMSLAPGSTYTLVGPQSLFDLESEMGPDGKVVLTPNIERFERMILPRFDRRLGLSRINYVLFVGEADKKNQNKVPDAVRAQLITFRTLKHLAASKGIDLALERAKFYLHSGNCPPKSFFVGEYNFNGTRVPFVNSYLNNAMMYKLPKCLLDDQVETTSVPAAVKEHEHLALILSAGLPAWSIDDLEDRYGHLVGDPNLKGVGPSMRLSPTVDFGDGSFNI